MKYAPRDQFLPFHSSGKRWSCLVCHRRMGKTVASITELITAAISTNKTDARYAYVAPFRHQVKDIAWAYLKGYTEQLRMGDPNESELSVTLRNGARIRLYGADNDQAMRGLYFDGVVLDEYADMRPRVWGEVVRPMLADRQGWAVFIGTPKGHNSFYDIYQKSLTDPNWFSMMARASTTGILSEAELTDLRSTMSEEEYAQELECSFEAAVRGAYYGKEMAELERLQQITDVPYDPAVPVHTAWDLGYTDDTTIWFFQLFYGEVHIIDSYSNNGHDIPHYAQIVNGKPYEYDAHWLPHDAKPKRLGSPNSIMEQLRAEGILGRIVPSLSVQDGIQAARKVLPLCWFDRKNCHEGIEALKLYQREWDDDKKVFRQTPRHDWTSHFADAFRYLAISHREPRRSDMPRMRHPNPNPKRGALIAEPRRRTMTWDEALKLHDKIAAERDRNNEGYLQ